MRQLSPKGAGRNGGPVGLIMITINSVYLLTSPNIYYPYREYCNTRHSLFMGSYAWWEVLKNKIRLFKAHVSNIPALITNMQPEEAISFVIYFSQARKHWARNIIKIKTVIKIFPSSAEAELFSYYSTSAIVFSPYKLIKALHFFHTLLWWLPVRGPEGPVKLTSYYKLHLPFKESQTQVT